METKKCFMVLQSMNDGVEREDSQDRLYLG